MLLIEKHKKQIEELCKKHNVKKLYTFGSVNTDKFTLESDIDLLVDFKTEDPLEYSDNYFDLKFKLEDIFNRKIDLLELKSLHNPFLKKTIDNTKILVYG
ncbi:MAG: nucleotidyltransferase domain-containing protein [Cyclobacteriaceae bacterium]|jgi:predicted nucleotidyltransferase|nr:nucleotidyltransferase domain-containing protein [Cytophagales bacterium]MCZ8328613.1 nucleotidyltransferase domain-containing protein [Cyclobacteriaceae bacterium]